jgi:hypothetical protein
LQRQLGRLDADHSFAKSREDVQALLGVTLNAETLRTVRAKHGPLMAAWQSHDIRSTTVFQEAAAEVEFTVDAGKVHTLEAGWKDLKIAVLPKRLLAEPASVASGDQQRLPEATARLGWGEGAPSKRFRRRWRRWPRPAGVEQPAQVHVRADGAGWMWQSAARVLPGSLQTLDIYHALGQGALAGQALYGEGSEAAEAFLQQGR